ncbi:MAG TPA: hypothetical protein VIG25_07680 [Pyrinomonadaceae bacterium]
MKNKVAFSLSIAVLLSCLLLSVDVAGFQAQQPPPKMSNDETKALNAINALTDPVAKVNAIGDFIKKYPKTPIRAQLADAVAGEIAKIKDPAQAVSLAETAQTIFGSGDGQLAVMAALLDSYLLADRPDDVFKVGTAILAKDPEEIHALVQMSFVSANQIRKQNPKFVQQGLQAGLKAIELIEADKKPAQMDAASWANHKAQLPQIYQQVAILSLVGGNLAEAHTRAVKATVIGPTDPTNFAVLGMVINNDYMQLATNYKTMTEGKEKQETLKKLEGLLDEVIDAYAHAVGLAVGKPEHQPMMQQLTVDLTSYYKFRHNQSTEGLQQLIDKYKPKP